MGKFDLSGYGFRKEDRAAIENARKGLSSEFQFEAKGNLIAIRYPGMAAVLEFRGDLTFLNGERFEISANRPLMTSLQNWVLNRKGLQGRRRAQLSPFLFALNGTLSEAVAQLDPVSYAVASTMASGGDMAAFGMNLAIGNSMAASASGAAAVLGGIAVAVAASAGVAYCEAYQLSGMVRTMRRRLNCYSQPLSWLGINPRDRLYVQSLACAKDDKQGYERIKVSMASSMGERAARELVFKDGNFFEFKDDASKKPDYSQYELKPGYGKLDPLSPSEKKYFQEVEKEAMRLRAICHDDKAYKELNAATERARSEGDIGTSQPPSRSIRATK